MVYFEASNVVHMGDDLWSESFPFVDLSSGGSVQGMADAVEKVLAEVPDDVTLIPGHGHLSTKKDMEEFHQMLTDCIELVRKQIAEGKSVQEVQEHGVPEKWAAWGNGFIKTDQWLETVYKSLSAGE